MKLYHILPVILVFLLTQCKKPDFTIVLNTELLSKEQASSMGFSKKASDKIEQSDWHKKQFGSSVIHSLNVRSLTPMKEDSAMFPRFRVIRESYDSPSRALKRMERINESDPAEFDKSISKGFVVNNEVWIVVADAHIFGYRELDNFISRLKILKKQNAEQGVAPNP